MPLADFAESASAIAGKQTSKPAAKTNGGHNAGVVSEPGRTNRHYRVATRTEQDSYIDPATWPVLNTPREGSWWPEWVRWLGERSGQPTSPPTTGAPEHGLPVLAEAPGTYVLHR